MFEKNTTNDNTKIKKERKLRVKKTVPLVEEPNLQKEPVPLVEVKQKKIKKKLLLSETKKESMHFDFEFPVEGPNILIHLPETLSILMSFFIVNHKYVGLQILENNLVKPFFFVVLESWSDKNKLKCQLFKHSSEKDEEGNIHVIPLWEELWVQKDLETDVIWNCIPFDETRDYHYFPTTL